MRRELIGRPPPPVFIFRLGKCGFICSQSALIAWYNAFKSWPIKFSCLTPWPYRKSGLDPWLSSINHAHQSPGEPLWPFLSCPQFLPWLLDQLQNFALTAWPHFDPGRGWEYSRLCSVPPPWLSYACGNYSRAAFFFPWAPGAATIRGQLQFGVWLLFE